MSIRSNAPCDVDGICPYMSQHWVDCEYWCGYESVYDHEEPYQE